MDPLTIQNTLRGISGIGQIDGSQEIRPLKPALPTEGTDETGETSFSQMLGNYLNDVNQKVLDSDQGMADLAVGKAQNLHNTLIAMQKADLQVKLLVETRNKVISAYQDIMRMQA